MDIINPIFYNPDASLSCCWDEYDFYGDRVIPEEEKKEISDIEKNLKNDDILNFVQYIDQDDFFKWIVKDLFLNSFNDFCSCIELYEIIANKLIYGNLNISYFFYFNKIFKKFVDKIFNTLHLTNTEERKSFVVQVNHFNRMKNRGGGVYGSLISLNKLKKDLKRKKTPNSFFKKELQN